MANQNLFEKYGIKEVADVTFYRIERKNEVYESQREISVSSILKGAITTQMVYPMEKGKGADTGFEAYVFTDADVLTHANYECDDKPPRVKRNITVTLVDSTEESMSPEDLISANGAIIKFNGESYTVPENATVLSKEPIDGTPDGLNNYDYTDQTIEIEVDGEGIVDGTSADYGTHEYSYEEQVLMLFAKKQNLIKKTGVRYQFTDTAIFENLEFNDEFAEAPNSTEKVVVLGLAGNFDAGSYLLDDVTEAIKMLNSKTYKAKAYDVTYKNYAELVVDDEMGYFNPNFLGGSYNKDGMLEVSYKNYENYKNDKDTVLLSATMWKENESCKSINDAIDALRKKKKALDHGEASALGKITSVKGGYTVTSELQMNKNDKDGRYKYEPTANSINKGYALDAVLEALNAIAVSNTEVSNVIISPDTSNQVSNRAIYVSVDNVDTAASAYIYLLRNVDYKKLATDDKGVFSFTDRNGNTAYYKDTIFAGVEYLALVIIGTMGLIFKVDRHGTKKIEQIAWMVNENGYITDKQAEKIVANGLIHTVDVDVNDETFEATCTVSNIKVRKINKTVNRYVPVLFLDTLKVSTLEQTAEQTAATGGKGNAQLIIWDYGKEITLTLQDALYSPASMSAMLGSYEGNDFTKGVKETKRIDRTEKCVAKRSFIVPAGNSKGVPSEGENTAQAVYIDLNTMQPYQDGAPIAEGEVYLKWTRSVAYGDNSLGNTIEISAEKFPGTYKVVGDTYARSKATGEDQRFQFVIPQAKMSSEQTITLEAEGDPTVFDMTLTVLRPDDGVMVKLIQYDVVENEEENDGSTMVKDTENLNLLDDAEMFKVSAEGDDDNEAIGATEY